MHIERMLVQDLRILRSVELRLSPGLNIFVGANGSGKTSLLEAAHLLSYGRSFRSGGRDVLVRSGTDLARVFAEIRGDSGGTQRLGIERAGSSWRGRVNDTDVGQLSELFRLCTVCCFEPGSHELVSGGAEPRRAMLDWGVFHVEPEFLPSWRRYQRALRQRNALIREQAPEDWFPAWEMEMASAALVVDRMRRQHADDLGFRVVEAAAAILPEFSGALLSLSSGWKGEEEPVTLETLVQRLAAERGRDRERGFTRRGPHRADWTIRFDQVLRREHLSRGQEKLLALTMVLAQLSCLQQVKREWPILLLDDLASELDGIHQRLVLDWIAQRPIQVLLTGVGMPDALAEAGFSPRVFHVEQGRVEAHH